MTLDKSDTDFDSEAEYIGKRRERNCTIADWCYLFEGLILSVVWSLCQKGKKIFFMFFIKTVQCGGISNMQWYRVPILYTGIYNFIFV